MGNSPSAEAREEQVPGAEPILSLPPEPTVFDLRAPFGRDSEIHRIYSFADREVGNGAYGSVRCVTHKTTGAKFAVKTIRKTDVAPQRMSDLQREIDVMFAVDHPNIIRLHEVYQDNRFLHLVEEMCEGGELFDRLVDVGAYSEAEAKCPMYEVLSAIAHCHAKGIVHRDLKPENIIFTSNRPSAEVKVIDFGLAFANPELDLCCGAYKNDAMAQVALSEEDLAALEERQKQEEAGKKKRREPSTIRHMHSRVGTSYYMAPEVLRKRADYTSACDVWSMGVVLYMVLGGTHPFNGASRQQIQDAIRLGFVKFPKQCFAEVSEEGKALIRSMLTMDPAERPSAQQCLDDPWFREYVEQLNKGRKKKSLFSNNQKQCPLTSNTVNHLKQFTHKTKLERAALETIARHLNEEDIVELREAFVALDKDHTGLISVETFSQALQDSDFHLVEREIRELVAGLDVHGINKVEYTEFLAATIDRSHWVREQNLKLAFDHLTHHAETGTIGMKELIEITGSKTAAADLLELVDLNGNGRISYGEFMEMMVREEESEDSVGTAGSRASARKYVLRVSQEMGPRKGQDAWRQEQDDPASVRKPGSGARAGALKKASEANEAASDAQAGCLQRPGSLFGC